MRFSLLALLLLAVPAAQAQREKLPDDDLAFVQATWPRAHKLFTGIRYVVERAGQGLPPRPGDMVSVLYQGYLLSEFERRDGKAPVPFDKVLDPAHAFQVRVGRGQVIEGWDEILQITRLGGKYLVVVPSELGYGSRGEPPLIPRDATLVFVIELLKIARQE